MNKTEALDLIRLALVNFIELDTTSILFVRDEDVDYSSPTETSVRDSNLFELVTDEDWNPYLSGSHTWVHAALLGLVGDRPILALSVGPAGDRARRPVGGHELNVNASAERRNLRVIQTLGRSM